MRSPFSSFSISTLSTVDGGDFGDVVPSLTGDVVGERLTRSFGLDMPKGLEDFEGLEVLEGLEANTGLDDSAGLMDFTGLPTDLEFWEGRMGLDIAAGLDAIGGLEFSVGLVTKAGLEETVDAEVGMAGGLVVGLVGEILVVVGLLINGGLRTLGGDVEASGGDNGGDLKGLRMPL